MLKLEHKTQSNVWPCVLSAILWTGMKEWYVRDTMQCLLECVKGGRLEVWIYGIRCVKWQNNCEMRWFWSVNLCDLRVWNARIFVKCVKWGILVPETKGDSDVWMKIFWGSEIRWYFVACVNSFMCESSGVVFVVFTSCDYICVAQFLILCCCVIWDVILFIHGCLRCFSTLLRTTSLVSCFFALPPTFSCCQGELTPGVRYAFHIFEFDVPFVFVLYYTSPLHV